MCRPLRAELHKTPLAAEFARIYAEALEIWNGPYMQEFAAYGLQHFKQVEENLDDLTWPLQNSPKALTPDEIFVLLSAACLHDIGIQLVDDAGARRKDAQHAHDLILHSAAEIGTETRQVTLSIRDEKSRIAIANVARAHLIEHALQLNQEDRINSQNVTGRLKLLGLLLATADLLDLSPVRTRYFRTIHCNLPYESELHRTMHQHVSKVCIRPLKESIPGKLQCQVEWNGDYPLVHDMNDWAMQWFDSQWRQLWEALSEASGGVIEWAHPWRDVLFRSRQGDVRTLSLPAHNILTAERADQRRIDRNAFASRFVEALKNSESIVFVAPAESDFEWQILSDWSEAYAQLHERCRVVRHEWRYNYPFGPDDIAAHFLSQLGHRLTAGQNPIKSLTDFLARDDGLSLVTIIKTDRPVTRSLHNLLQILVQRNNSTTARICLLFCPDAKGPEELGDAAIVPFDTLSLPRKEIEEHLRKRGYSSGKCTEIYDEMDLLNLTSHPTGIYTFIQLYCNHRSRMRP